MKFFLSSSPLATNAHSGNSFDLIRFVAAFGVLFSHSFALLGKPEPRFYGGQTLGSLCVFVFFAVSGYLVMTSWDRTRSIRIFIVNRGLRIFPALVVCLVLCAFVLGPVVTVFSPSAYFLSMQPYAYVATNLLMFTGYVGNALPGTFQYLPISNTINGSLWTIRYEIFMYLILLGIVCITARSLRVIAMLLAGFVSIWALGTYRGLAEPGILMWRLEVIGLSGKLLNLAPFFLVGALLAQVPKHYFDPRAAGGLAIASMLLYDSTVAMAVLWFTLPLCVLTLAFHSPKVLNVFGKKGDFSYGVYLYAFPVQQTLAQLHVESWWIHLLLSCLITLILAVLSWKLIERPALKLKPRFARDTSQYIQTRRTFTD